LNDGPCERQSGEVFIGPPLAEVIFTPRAGVSTECGDLNHALHTGDDTSVKQGRGRMYMNCLKSFEVSLAHDPDGIDHEVDAAQSGNPVAETKVMREVGEYKLLMQRSGQRRATHGNYGVTSPV
jgi:hypothetical protein